MPETLSEIERRVFGVLLEKSLAQPQYYPLTLNAVTTACNQKNNRDPVLELDEDGVWNTLEVLRAGGLVARLLPGGASRVERYRHEAKEFFGWEKPQRAVMAELLLRGPQTVGELRTHCARMYPFENVDAVSTVLDSLSQSDPPRVGVLPRAAGQAATRYAHRLYLPEEWAALDQPPAATGVAPLPAPSGPTPTESSAPTAEIHDLRNQVESLRAELAELRQALNDLRRVLGDRPPSS